MFGFSPQSGCPVPGPGPCAKMVETRARYFHTKLIYLVYRIWKHSEKNLRSAQD
jgi:hypothetical protein